MRLNKCKGIISFLLFSFCLLVQCHFAEGSPRVVKDVEMKGGPLGLAIDEKEQRLFILNYDEGTLVIIHEKDITFIKKISLNKKIDRNVDTRSALYDQGLNRIYISTGDEGVLVIDGATYETLFAIKENTRRFIPDVAFDDNHLYLLDLYGYIHRYSKKGKLEASLEIKSMVDSHMYRGPLNRLYLSAAKKGLGVVDGKKNRVIATVPIDAFSVPEGSGNTVYVAGPGKLYAIDAKSLKVKMTIDVDYPPRGGLGMAINPNTGHLFLVTSEDTVTVIDTKKGKKMDKLKVCKGPWSIAVSKGTNTVYVACPNSDTITVIKDGVE